MNIEKVIDQSALNPPDTSSSADGGGTIVSTLIHHPRMKTIIGEYVQKFPETVAKLLELIDRADWPSLRFLVHQIRGAGGGYGFDALSEFAGRVEDSIIAFDSPASIVAKTHSLIEVIRRTQGYGQSAAEVSIRKNVG